MIERLITFETAKLAKEKEFGYDFAKKLPAYVPMFYCELNLDFNLDLTTLEESECQGEDIVRCDFYYRSTQSLLQKWLREVHNIHIVVTYTGKWFVKWKKGYGAAYVNPSLQNNKSYEESLEVGLQEALKLI